MSQASHNRALTSVATIVATIATTILTTFATTMPDKQIVSSRNHVTTKSQPLPQVLMMLERFYK